MNGRFMLRFYLSIFLSGQRPERDGGEKSKKRKTDEVGGSKMDMGFNSRCT